VRVVLRQPSVDLRIALDRVVLRPADSLRCGLPGRQRRRRQRVRPTIQLRLLNHPLARILDRRHIQLPAEALHVARQILIDLDYIPKQQVDKHELALIIAHAVLVARHSRRVKV
jgi:hypothetical protein